MTDQKICVFWHPLCFEHDTGKGVFVGPESPYIEIHELHPENYIRVKNIKSVLEKGPLKERLLWQKGRKASLDEIKLFHTPGYVEEISSIKASSPTIIDDNETVMSSKSWDASLFSCGSALDATDYVLSGKGVSYALIRPPGHHAQPDRADGYCIFNNAGISAAYAIKKGIERIAVIDWDVHHGNGTQEGFYDRDDVLTISIHMDHRSWDRRCHPQDGFSSEIGRGKGVGYNRNIPLPFGAGNTAYARVMDDLVFPLIKDFSPQLIIIANGQDASMIDPNGRQCLNLEGFRMLGEKARNWSLELCDGRLVLFQEGGYARCYTAFCANATLEGILGVKESTIGDGFIYPDDYDDYSVGLLSNIKAEWEQAIAENSQ